jgi:hypothetical protein
MAVFDPKTEEYFLKVVYFGLNEADKISNLQSIFKQLSPHMATPIFNHSKVKNNYSAFSFLPIQLPSFTMSNNDSSKKYRLHVFSLNEPQLTILTEHFALQEIDCAVCLLSAESQFLEANFKYIEEIKEKLAKQDYVLNHALANSMAMESSQNLGSHKPVPLIIQFTHHDSPAAIPFAVLKSAFLPYVESSNFILSASPHQDVGVFETLSAAVVACVSSEQNASVH